MKEQEEALEEAEEEALQALEGMEAQGDPGTLTQAVDNLGASNEIEMHQERERELIRRAGLYVEASVEKHYVRHPALPPNYRRLSFAEKLLKLRQSCSMPDDLFEVCNRMRDWRNISSHIDIYSSRTLPSRDVLVRCVQELKEKLAALPPVPRPQPRPTMTQQPQPPNLRWPRQNLSCPFHEKDLARQRGAQWDPGRKVWFAPQGMDPAPFSRWL